MWGQRRLQEEGLGLDSSLPARGTHCWRCQQAQAWTEAWPLEAPPPEGSAGGGPSTPSSYLLASGHQWAPAPGATRRVPQLVPLHTQGACLLLGLFFQEAAPHPPGRGQLRPLPVELSPPTGVFTFLSFLLQTVSSLKWCHCVSTALVSQLDVDQSLSRLNLCAM